MDPLTAVAAPGAGDQPIRILGQRCKMLGTFQEHVQRLMLLTWGSHLEESSWANRQRGLCLPRRDDVTSFRGATMPVKRKQLSPEQERAVLRFWAHGADIARTFTREEIAAVEGLDAAIEAVYKLPGSLGWGDEEPRGMVVVTRQTKPFHH